MIMSNPHLNEAINLIKSSGGDGRAALINYAKQIGLDPQSVLNSLQ